ncbi:hypothetical protein FVE85_9841 [Porphyridium purpureum]|uniref:GNAT family N-acetyltransferase n=1 Tax=Porphyridium purpureum TaxID=35688 RepID=A0A5J4YHQ7_PORPP|nr:hypothetical protein FVE85_9841 [Porphyridium purpureum]|eukprot:POR2175..scf289_17
MRSSCELLFVCGGGGGGGGGGGHSKLVTRGDGYCGMDAFGVNVSRAWGVFGGLATVRRDVICLAGLAGDSEKNQKKENTWWSGRGATKRGSARVRHVETCRYAAVRVDDGNEQHRPQGGASRASAAADDEWNAAELEFEVVDGVQKVGAAAWDALLCDDDSPFLLHDWMRCMEESDCASTRKGWTPSHLLVRRSGGSGAQVERGGAGEALLAVVPVYIKMDSMGEFVFDQQWAEIAYANGIPYYPKMLVGVPFTPASGRRFLTAPGLSHTARERLVSLAGRALMQLAQRVRTSSVHVNFCEQDEVEALTALGFAHRRGVQYHFKNHDGNEYTSFDDYLARFKSKKRIQMKRERKSVYEDAQITIRVLRGDEIPKEMYATMYDIYCTTIDKMFIWGRKYLSRRFFQLLSEAEHVRPYLTFIVAYNQRGAPVAGTFNLVKSGRFYGRYWGALEEIRNLHFETCYYRAIEYVIEHGLRTMEPGAGGGDFKHMRGFDPVITHSMHWCANPALHDFIVRFADVEGGRVESAVDAIGSSIRQPSPSRSTPASGTESDGQL